MPPAHHLVWGTRRDFLTSQTLSQPNDVLVRQFNLHIVHRSPFVILILPDRYGEVKKKFAQSCFVCYNLAMIFLPITRPWAVKPVLAALNASDIPHRALLLLDAPDCDIWIDEFTRAGWEVGIKHTHNPEPPAGRIERRSRHLAMRRLSQELTRDYGRVLYLEDDTLVPERTWKPLNALLDKGYKAASGVQRGRHGNRGCGVWHYNFDAGIMDIYAPEGISEADAVGHYCLLTTGDYYAGIPINPGPNEPIDCAHTRFMAPIAVDASVWCGHLLENGDIIA